METTLDIILAIAVLAFLDTINKINPYLGFFIMLLTAIYLLVKIYYTIKNKGK